MSHADLRRYIRIYDQDLDPQLCQQMIGSFAGLERFQLRNGRGVRRGLEDSAWTELNVSRLSVRCNSRRVEAGGESAGATPAERKAK